MSETALAVAPTGALMPAMDITQAMARYQAMNDFVKGILKDGVDYGKIPGTGDKPTLLKPGAEKLTTFFGLSCHFEFIERTEDWLGEDHAGEPFFYYLYRCQLYRDSLLVAEADGSCNSMESKYRWRWAPENDIPPSLDPALLKQRDGSISEFTFAVDKAETTGKYGKPVEYWQRFRDAIESGTARKFKKSTKGGKEYDAWEIGATVYRIPNDDIASQVNTLQKMGQKRALVAATLLAVNASEYFTQDIEDMDFGPIIETGEIIDSPGKVVELEQPPEPVSNGNEHDTHDVPSSPKALLAYVNQHVEVPYDAVVHMFNAIKKELGDDWKCPQPDDADGWNEARKEAIAQAEAKVRPTEAEQEGTPL